MIFLRRPVDKLLVCRRRYIGFTMIEMTVVMVILGLIAISMLILVPGLTDRMRLNSTVTGLGGASEAITGFAVENSRLPCPDGDGDGLEGVAGACTVEVGTIPFRSLGLPGPALDEARLPLRYGVNEELVTLTNLFEPNIPGALVIVPGTQSTCGEAEDGVIQIGYNNGPTNTLTVALATGTFEVKDIVSGSRLDYDTVVANGSNTDFSPGEEINLIGLAPIAHCAVNTGTACTTNSLPNPLFPLFGPLTISDCPDAAFPAFELCVFEAPSRNCEVTTATTCTVNTDCPLIVSDLNPPDPPVVTTVNEACVIGLHRVCVSGENQPITQTCVIDADCPGSDTCIALPPTAVVDSLVDLGAPNALNDRLLLPSPSGEFSVGETIIGLTSGVKANVTDFYFPGSAEVTSIISDGPVFDEYGVTLTPPASPVDKFIPPNFGFKDFQLLFAKPSDEKAIFTSLTKNTQTPFQDGETITGADSGATGTIDSHNNTTLVVSGVVGAFDGPGALTFPLPTEKTDPALIPGEVITGNTSGATAIITSITVGGGIKPGVTPGSITIPNSTFSGQLNQLDMCKNLRSGIQGGLSTGDVHTVNASSVKINPAYLVLSGGVEDAIPGDVAFDGLNENIATVDFNSPALGRNASYDDLVRAIPMQYLDQRLACPRNLGAVNAMATSAMVAQNIAISSFNNNENALQAILDSWAGLKLADADIALSAAGLIIAASECARATTAAIKLAGASTAGAVLACAFAVKSIADLAIAITNQVKAKDLYDFSCTDQVVASNELAAATAAATAALARAQQADIKGGVE